LKAKILIICDCWTLTLSWASEGDGLHDGFTILLHLVESFILHHGLLS